MLSKSASVPSFSGALISSLVVAGSGDSQEWGAESGRLGRTASARSPLPRSITHQRHTSFTSQPSLASHRLDHCESTVSRASSDWGVDTDPPPSFRRSKSEADLSCLVTPCSRFLEGEPTLSSVSEEAGSDIRSNRRGQGPSLSRYLSQERRSVLGLQAHEEESDGEGLLTLTEEPAVKMIGGRRMLCGARGCRPLTDEELCTGVVPAVADCCEQEGCADRETYYLDALAEDPENALLLRNYASFLYQVQRDYPRAEEYYERAILASPADGDVLAQYAKLIYDVHGDVERATDYYEQAVKAAPEDCYILASFASFLWSSESSNKGQPQPAPFPVHHQVCHPEAPGCLIPPVA